MTEAYDFHRDGFAIFRSVLAETECEALRAAVLREGERAEKLGRMFKPVAGEITPVGDIVGREGIGQLVLDDRLLAIARQLVGRDDLVYFGDSGVMVGGRGRGFHKDNTCRDDPSHADWLTPYTLVRFGIYLQDHAEHSGGVKVRRGSHLSADVTTGEIVDVPTTTGDVVVWSLRTTHSGHAMRLRGLPWPKLQPRFEARLPEVLARPEPCTRAAIFITYGTNDAHLERYVQKHANLVTYPENYLYKSWLYSKRDADFIPRAMKRGVTVLTPVPDYGALFGSTDVLEGGVTTLPGKPDRYVARGMERVIQGVGAVVRAIQSPLLRSSSASARAK